MNRAILFFFILLGGVLHAQSSILTDKESIVFIPVGDSPGDAFFNATDEGLNSLGSPIIDQNGNIIFFENVDGECRFMQIRRKERTVFPYNGNLSDFRLTGNRHIESQQGMQVDVTPLLFYTSFFYEYNYREKQIHLNGGYYSFYPAPFGGIYYSDSEKIGIALLFDVAHPNKEFSVVDQSKIAAWLPSQPGGFTIGSDGLLYRNGILYSAIRPKGTENYDWRYLGRLASGHAIWAPGPPEIANIFKIVDSRGNVELDVKIVANTKFSYGLGPWGEFYYLFAPPMDKRLDPKNDYYRPEPGVPAELAVYRSHLKYFGRLNDSNVRLRKDPSTSADILGTYPAKTGFRIIEKGTKQETIGGKTDYWYHVRLLDGREGWFFGSLVQNLYDGPNGEPPPWPNVADW